MIVLSPFCSELQGIDDKSSTGKTSATQKRLGGEMGDDEDDSFCWDISRVLFMIFTIFALLLGSVYYFVSINVDRDIDDD